MRIADYIRRPSRRERGAAALAARAREVGPAELVTQRDQLSAQLAELQWDLGGLVYEMARRDHFRLDVVIRQAAKLQAVDAELGEVERLLHLDRAGAGGTCPACGALHARGAVYCWQCGTDLMAREPVGGETASSATQAREPSARPAIADEPPATRRFVPPPEEPSAPAASTGAPGARGI